MAQPPSSQLYVRCIICNISQFHTEVSPFSGICITCVNKRQYQQAYNVYQQGSIQMPRYKNTNSNSTSGKISCIWNPDIEAYEVSFPYNDDFIKWIKTNINTNDRSLDFDRNRNPQYKWLFKEQVFDSILLPMMKNVFFPHGKYTIIDKVKVEEYNKGFVQTVAIDTDALKIEFHKLVSEAGVSLELPPRKQYLRAAMYYHPDRNPDKAHLMSRLNEIWSTVFEPKQQELMV